MQQTKSILYIKISLYGSLSILDSQYLEFWALNGEPWHARNPLGELSLHSLYEKNTSFF